MPLRFALFVGALVLAPRDLDVGVPPGSPLDFLRLPPGNPREKDVETPGGSRVGKTVSEDQLPRPHQLMPLNRPLTVDFGNHLNWTPRDPNGGGATGDGRGRSGYPPAYTEDLYFHCASFFLMIMLHPDQVSPREILSYLVELGEPAAYAAMAVRGEPALRDMARYVLEAAGGVPPGVPGGPFKDKIDKDVAEELILSFPYGPRFGSEFLKLPARITIPSLEKFAASRHRFLARNAVFALRLYDETSVLPVLREALKSQDKVLRNRALAGLIRWRDPDVVPWLIDQMDGSDLPFRSYAIYALGRIGDGRAVMPLVNLTRHYWRDWEFVWAALAALARIQDGRPEVVALLVKIREEIPRLELPPARREILLERAQIASAFIGDKFDQAWIARTGGFQEANKALVKEWLQIQRKRDDLARRPPPAPKPAPAPKPPPPPAPEPVKDPAEQLAAEVRASILEYSGVTSVAAERGLLRIVVVSREDAEDLTFLLGSQLKGIPVVIQLVP